MKKLIVSSIAFWLLFPIITIAQLTISGEIRPRAEYRHGFKNLADKNQDAAFFIDQRSRLNFDLTSKKVQYYLSLQDVRTWGNQPQLVVNQGASTGLHQAWAKVIFDKKWAMKLGRQEIAYDDHRIFGNVGWAQQARSHDAAVFIFQDSSFTGHLGLAFNQDKPQLATTRYTIGNNYKVMQFLWLHKDWNKFKGSLLLLNNGRQVTFSNGNFETNFSQTIGGRLTYKENKFTTNLALYYQGGTNTDILDSKINAYYFGADIAYALSENITLSGGVEILSGNDQLDANGKNNAFTPFYGTNHKFNGHMDYFYVGNHVGSVGLNDIFLKAIYKKKKFDSSLTLHYFLSNSNIANNGKAMENYLGTELDYAISWKFSSGATLKLGYSQLFGSETMEVLKGGDHNETNNWFWAMVIVKPSFTLQKNK